MVDKMKNNNLIIVGLGSIGANLAQFLLSCNYKVSVWDKDLSKLNKKNLNDTLVSVFGIGPWSVNMFEIFCLGKLDIFSSKDAGLRLAMNNSKMIKKDCDWVIYDQYAEQWSPYRTIASIHLWKTVD